MKIYCDNYILGDRIKLANKFFNRLKGLMGKKRLEKGEGLLLLNCSLIHNFFMEIPIDAVYLSHDMTVLAVETLQPWKLGKIIKNTSHILELDAGAAWVTVGDMLEICN